MAKKGTLPKADYSFRNFSWVMRKEIAVFCGSVFFGIFIMPKLYNSA